VSEPAPSEVKGEVIVVEPQDRGIVRAAPADVVAAVNDYREIQKALDASMPDCLMTIQGKQFRKKNYWRGIATAFNLTVTLKSELRAEHDGDWGYHVIYNAAASNGRSADGDGSCFASEKVSDRNPTTTVHNVRAHAHTRAYNRAVSNLCGFGEVSAEEMIQSPQRPADRPPAAGRTITQKQAERLYAKGSAAAKRLNVPAEQVDEYAKRWITDLGLSSSMDLTRESYDILCDKLDVLTLGDLVPPAEGEEVL
jgi:hypothetical protein